MKTIFLILLFLSPIVSFGQIKAVKKDTTLLVKGKLPNIKKDTTSKKITKKVLSVDQNEEELSSEYIETPFQGKEEPEIIIEEKK